MAGCEIMAFEILGVHQPDLKNMNGRSVQTGDKSIIWQALKDKSLGKCRLAQRLILERK